MTGGYLKVQALSQRTQHVSIFWSAVCDPSMQALQFVSVDGRINVRRFVFLRLPVSSQVSAWIDVSVSDLSTPTTVILRVKRFTCSVMGAKKLMNIF